MESSASPKDFFDLKQPSGTNVNGDAEYNTIWGKLYTWDQAMGNSGFTGACPNGWRVPSDADWTELENTLNGSVCRTGDGWECTGLGWQNHNARMDSNNLANALKAPLSGYRYTDGASFNTRGFLTNLWSSTPNSSSAYVRFLLSGDQTVSRFANSQALGVSVRCIRD